MGITVSTWNSETKSNDLTVEHVGMVVGVESTYQGDCDSLYYAVYFDADSAEFKTLCTGYTPAGIEVDAPEAIMEAWTLEQAAKAAARKAAAARTAIRRQMREAEVEAHTPSKGKTVRVARGRKVPVGTVGVVKVNCDGQWGRRVLLTLEDGTEVWTAQSNVEVVQAEVLAV